MEDSRTKRALSLPYQTSSTLHPKNFRMSSFKTALRNKTRIQQFLFQFFRFSLFSDGKFHQLPSGELLIHNLEFSDQFPTYRCRTMHRLSKQVTISSPANVRITGKGCLFFLLLKIRNLLCSSMKRRRNL